MGINNIHNFLIVKSEEISSSLGELLTKNGPLQIPEPISDVLPICMVKTVIGQQLSKSAANSIWTRLEAMCHSRLISIMSGISGRYNEGLLGCGVSKFKVKALNSIHHTFDEYPDFEAILGKSTDEDAIAMITSIWGLGSWSADMTLLFYFKRKNIWSPGDVSLNRGLRKILNDNSLCPQGCDQFAKQFSPFRSYLALHIWRGLDNGLLT